MNKYKLVNRETGEVLDFDDRDRRIRRLRRRIGSWSRVMAGEWNDRNKNICTLYTLTYAGVGEWKPDHIKEFMRHVKRHLKNLLIGYAWCAELQERGAVHYHVMVIQRRGIVLPKPDDCGWWPYGMTSTETARKPGYLVKYQQKGMEEEDPKFPHGLRIFGVVIASQFRKPCFYQIFRASTLPGWMEKIYIGAGASTVYFPKRKRGGGWLMNGEFYETEWLLKIVRDEYSGGSTVTDEPRACEKVGPRADVRSTGGTFERRGERREAAARAWRRRLAETVAQDDRGGYTE